MVLLIDALSVGPGSRPILKDLQFRLEAGEVMVLLGPNGAGKSTLMRALSGESRPLAGAVRLEGQPIDQIPPATLARQRAFLTQEDHLCFSFPVDGVVRLGAYPHRRYTEPRTVATGVAQLLDTLELSALARRDYLTLSGGEKLRVQLARTLLQVMLADRRRPRWLLLDEPTASLDLRHQRLTLELVRHISRSYGIAVGLILHDLNLAVRFGDRLAVIDGDQLRGPLPAEALLRDVPLSRIYGVPLEINTEPGEPPSVQLVLDPGSGPSSFGNL